MMASSLAREELPREPYKLAKYGISLTINNQVSEAEELFRSNLESIQMAAGYSLIMFMDALMSFDEDKFHEAIVLLQETEKKCAANIGWLKSVKNKIMGSEAPSIADRLEMQIILADTQVCIAILTFLQQDFSGYFKGGWMLRKAWKIYQQTYLEIVNIYKKKVGEFNLPDPTDFEWKDTQQFSTSTSPDSAEQEWVIPEINPPSSSKQNCRNGDEIDAETTTRLMSAVCFGYGVLQLGISLLPPSILKVSNFLGFNSNRTTGISNLMYARKGSDMRAPLATLALLWYHTIVRPFYALDGNNVKAGLEAANLLLEESMDEYENSALFLFFRGRTYRLDSNISHALESFQLAANNSSQREVKLLSLHEVGWCYLIQLNYPEAQKAFLKLKQGSRWSKCFYTYLSVICSGSFGIRELNIIHDLINIYKGNAKLNQLDTFIKRRIKYFPVDEESSNITNDTYWRLLTYELIYLWNALPSCSSHSLNEIIRDCNESTQEPMPGLAKLIQGECYTILRLYDEAIACFRRCIEIRSEVTPNDDLHISANAEHSLGVLLIKNQETQEEGKTILQHCSSYKDYDFDNKLLVRIDMALKSVS